MNTITRRIALAASVTLPLLPVASYATPADPAVEADRITVKEINVCVALGSGP